MALTSEQRIRAEKLRAAMDAAVPHLAASTEAINACIDMIRPWKPGVYEKNDVRDYNGTPYKCVQGHDSTANPGWTPAATPALWMQYHGTTKDSARPWVQPTGAHDMYLHGEYMIWTDGKTYKCISDTNFSPVEYAQAWSVV